MIPNEARSVIVEPSVGWSPVTLSIRQLVLEAKASQEASLVPTGSAS
jgi:hypothetical protein